MHRHFASRFATFAAQVLAATTLAAAAFANPAERAQDRWNLADLYPTAAAWNEDAARLEAQLTQFGECRGQLGASATRLRECLDLQSAILKRYYRMAVYANELHSEDTGAAAGLELRQRSRVLGSKLTQASAFVNPELLALGAARIDAFLAAEPGLRIYRHPLAQVLRAAPHTLDGAGEAIVASFALSANAAGSAYEILANADMPWPTITLADGSSAKLDQSGYEKHRESANRDDRKKVFDAYWSQWKAFERTTGVTFYSSLKEDTVYARVRRYPDSLARSLEPNKLPQAVYDQLVKSANESLPTLHRYFRLRARMLGVAQMGYHDIYPPMVGAGRVYPIDEGIRFMLESAKPLGDDYVAAMAAGVKDRWMDVYPRPRKLSGAHMAGAAYEVHPYVLMNYNGNWESVSTLAHEWGHAMHSYLSNRAQPFPTARYATFVAEIASMANEALLLDYALKHAKDDDERLNYLDSALERLRGGFFRQVMFAEFEREVHARVDKGEAMTGEKFTRAYGELLRRYHGHDQGIVRIDDLYAVEWSAVPHFYRAFYVFQYATSIAAASLFAEAILQGKPGARERYLGLLSAGSSGYPYDLVKAAGVDLATPAPYQAVATRMNRIMDEIEAIQARRAARKPAG